MGFIRCAIYFALTGVIGFLAGRIIPKKWLRPRQGIFRCFPFEKDGKIYEKLGIRYWQNKLPDMSRILPFMMPAKKLGHNFYERLPEMICETCIAELIHALLCLSGLYCLKLWPGAGGIIAAIVYILLFNLPFILIQRYNRPRLIRLQQRYGAHIQVKKELPCVH